MRKKQIVTKLIHIWDSEYALGYFFKTYPIGYFGSGLSLRVRIIPFMLSPSLFV